MEYLLSESKGYSEDKFVDSINIMIKDFIINYVGDTPIQDQMSIVDSFVSYYENNDTIDDDLFDPIFQDHFNSTALEQIDTLNSILQGNYSSYSQLKDDLVEWEQDVDSLSNISGDQERALLNGGNVARYSSLFWDTYNPNDYKTNHKIGGPANPDANGFINGFIIGTSLGYSVFESIIIGIMVGAVCSALYAPEPPIV